MIIESVVNDRYETYLDNYILAPMDMHDSTFAFTTQASENAGSKLAWAHVDDGSRYAASPIFLRPAGQFTTTAVDLARFAEFLMSDGVINGQQFFNKTLMRSRGKPSETPHPTAALAQGMPLAWGAGTGTAWSGSAMAATSSGLWLCFVFFRMNTRHSRTV